MSVAGNMIGTELPSSQNGVLWNIQRNPETGAKKPLKFRSFDEFYTHYGKSQSNKVVDGTAKATPNVPMSSTKLTVLSPKATSLASPNAKVTTIKSPESKLISKVTSLSAAHGARLAAKPASPVVDKEANTEMNGKVKMLCQIFQKAHGDANYNAVLKQKIYNHKRNVAAQKKAESKAAPINSIPKPHSPCATITYSYDYNKPSGVKEIVAVINRNSSQTSSPASSISSRCSYFDEYTKQPIQRKESRVGRTTSSLAIDPSCLQIGPCKQEEEIVDVDQLADRLEGCRLGEDLNTSFASNSTLSQTLIDEPIDTLIDQPADEPTEDPIEEPIDAPIEGPIDEGLIDDVLDNFLNDETFCDQFPELINEISNNITTQEDALHLQNLINEIHNHILDQNEVKNEVYNQSEATFEWFFNRHTVGIEDVIERTPIETKQFAWVNELHTTPI